MKKKAFCKMVAYSTQKGTISRKLKIQPRILRRLLAEIGIITARNAYNRASLINIQQLSKRKTVALLINFLIQKSKFL